MYWGSDVSSSDLLPPPPRRQENLAVLRFPLVAMVLVRAKDLRHPRQGFAPRRGALDTLELLFQADREIGGVILPVAPDRALQFGVACLEAPRSEEHTSELQSLMRISYAVFCLKKKRRE